MQMNNEKIIAHFGVVFFEKIVQSLQKYAELWDLRGFEQVDYYSINCIFTCESKKFGSCVLKIGTPSRETMTEYAVLSEYSAYIPTAKLIDRISPKENLFCEVYEADIDNGVLLVERIYPGTLLRAEADIDKRLDVFCGVLQKLHIKEAKPEAESIYPTYMDWVSKINMYMKNRGDYKYLSDCISAAELICRELCRKYPGEVLLHGDLHHDNILLGAGGRYRIIDPKGVIGDPVFDIPRFIINEFDGEYDESFRNKITHIVSTISRRLAVPETDIRKLIFMEAAMAESWSVESGDEPEIEGVKFAEEYLRYEQS